MLILVKHSLPEIDPGRNASEWRLSEAGRKRCTFLADALAAYRPDLIACSLEPKALQTAQIVAVRLDKPLEPFAGLHEHLRRNEQITGKEEFEANVAQFFRQPNSLVFGEETADQAYRRFSQAVAGLTRRHAGQNLVVVAHGTVITLFVAHACGMEPFPLWKRLDLPSFVVLALPELELINVVDSVLPSP